MRRKSHVRFGEQQGGKILPESALPADSMKLLYIIDPFTIKEGSRKKDGSDLYRRVTRNGASWKLKGKKIVMNILYL